MSFSKAPSSFASSTLSFPWANDVLHALITHFKPQSFSPLGNGVNSTAHVMENSSGKQVVRLFPYFQLCHKSLATQYRLTKDHVGGEWLSAAVSGKHLATNAHLIVWNPRDNTFKVMNQKQVKAVLDARGRLKQREELYVAGTIGNYIEGSKDLSHVLKEQGPMSEAQVRKITKKVLKGLSELNEQKVVHRDLKNANMIQLPGGKIKLIDFGTASLYSGKKLPYSGDFHVHPIESFAIDARPRTGIKTDSYGVFLLAYQLLTGVSYQRDSRGKEIQSRALLRCFHTTARQIERTNPLLRTLALDPKLEGVSLPFIHLLASLGTSNPKKRLTAAKALELPIWECNLENA